MNKTEALQTIKELENKAGELKKFVEDCDKSEKWTPKIGEKYFFLDELNRIHSEVNNTDYDKDLIQSGNFFQTEALAYSEKMRRESMKRDWLPKIGEKCCKIFLGIGGFYLVKNYFNGDNFDMELYYLGRIKKTEQEAQNWIDTYGKYWVEKE
jgi:hypothetical protein